MNDSLSNLELANDVSQSHAGQQPENARGYRLRVEFTGSGSEYFRIWIVNLLLMMVTLGIYYPWAKVRRLRYFHGNTLVDGEPLGFHGNPRKMLTGYMLVGLMLTGYSVAGKLSAMAGFVAFAIIAAVWPALLKSSMQFRLANTSWRGLRFRFKGTLGDAYRAMLPLFLPSLVVLGAVVAVADPEKPPHWYVFTLAAVGLVSLAVSPWLFWNLKQYQHNNYALASLQTSFKASVGSFYGVLFKTLGVTLLPLLVMGALTAFVFWGKTAGAFGTFGTGSRVAIALALGLGFFAALVIMLVVVKPYMTSRVQNLVWSRTGNTSLRFLSHLRFWPLLGLTLKNWLLVMLTLGFYWPFAAVALARIRLQAIHVKTRDHPATLVSSMLSAEGDTAGDAAGDLLGLDIGF
jgi:uncharacterized membrane protein YjgN (DUF898 family)